MANESNTLRPKMTHLNGDLMCALDVETTGLNPGHHEVYELAIIPLNAEFKPNRDYHPLDIMIMPEFPNRIDWFAINQCGNRKRLEKAITNGLTVDAAQMLINRWFEGLQLINKKIAPLTQNGIFDMAHLREFLGQLTYDYMFNTSQTRDTMYLARCINDLFDAKLQNFPYPKVDLKYLCICLDIDSQKYGKTHQAFVDALLTADVYAGMINHLKQNTTI